MNRLTGRIIVTLSLISGLLLLSITSFSLATNNIEHKITVIPKISLPLSTASSLPANFLAVLNQKGPYLPINILLLGSDTRVDQGAGFGKETGARSDTVMLLHLNANRDAATAISFPRDMWVKTPECASRGGSENKFNAVFAYGGPGCTATLVADIIGVVIDHIVVVDFTGFKEIIDAMGGLNVCLAKPVNDSKAKVNLPSGQQLINGAEALGLARARYSLADGSDLERINRQQAIVLLAAKQIKSSGVLTNPSQLYKLAGAFASALSVDQGLANLSSLAGLAWQIRDIPLDKIQMLTVPYLKDSLGHYIVNSSVADPIFLALQNDTIVPWAVTSTTPTVTPTATPSVIPTMPTSPTPTPVGSSRGQSCSPALF